jgi:hypothetical protein
VGLQEFLLAALLHSKSHDVERSHGYLHYCLTILAHPCGDD